ncbi:DNA polymerase IV [Nocardioides alcanivorans]|uniref:DNA polymerase IV n=1 Tax=Nocardioides alcanivorans TaxID=2897352 RepID=UPI001F1D4B8F|nr:DNA polymerase IV [Nocardioides alcanivorans]
MSRDRWVLHVDLDQFLAAVEVLRRPELAGLPVVVGGRGDPTERGVVSTASYEARAFGVRSGMPLRTALKRCPEAVFLPVDFPVYEAASAQVMDTLRGLRWEGRDAVVQVLGWDEAFLALRSEDDARHEGDPPIDPQGLAQKVRADVLEVTGLRCSVGIGNNPVQAKIATDFGKPEPGVHTIGHATWGEQMGHRPTRSLWGVGTKISQRLARLGIETVDDLAGAGIDVLADEFGPGTGPWLQQLGRGLDTRRVDATPWVPRAHGREETFQADLEDWTEVEAELRRITARVVTDIDAEGRLAERVGIKVRLKPFLTFTRVHKLPAPSNDPEVLGNEAVALLERIERRAPVRLLGVRLEMVEPPGGY